MGFQAALGPGEIGVSLGLGLGTGSTWVNATALFLAAHGV